MTRVDIVNNAEKRKAGMNKIVSYNLAYSDAAYGTLLDYVYPEKSLQEKRDMLSKYIYDNAESFVNGYSNPALPDELKEYQAEYNKLYETIQSIPISMAAMPLYRNQQSFASSEIPSQVFNVKKADTLLDQPIYPVSSKYEGYKYWVTSANRLNTYASKDSNGKYIFTDNENAASFGGIYTSERREAYNIFLENTYIFALSEYLKNETDKLPLFLSEAQELRSKNFFDSYNNPTADVTAFINEYNNMQTKLIGKNSIKKEDFEKYCLDNGITQDNLYKKYAATNADIRVNTPSNKRNVNEYHNRYRVLDIFGKSTDGTPYADHEIIQAFLTKNYKEQRNILGIDKNARYISTNLNSNNLLWISQDEYNRINEINKTTKDEYTRKRDVKNAISNLQIYMEDNGQMKKIGNYDSYADKLMISGFRKYISQSEWEDVISKFEKEGIEPRFNDNYIQGIENGIAILEHLDATGYEYELDINDRRKGELEIRINGLPVKVKIYDNENPEYVGRTFSHGKSTYLSCDNTGNNGEFRKTQFMPTSKMVVDLVDYSLGNPIKTGSNIVINGDENAYVGTPGKVYYKESNTGKYFELLYRGEVRSSSYKAVSSNVVYDEINLNKPHAICIFNRTETGEKNIFFDDANDAKGFITKEIDKAKNNFTESVMSALYINDGDNRRLRTAEEMNDITISEDPQIRTLQLNYIKYLSNDDAVLNDLNIEGNINEKIETLDYISNDNTYKDLDLFKDNRSKEERIKDNLFSINNTLFGDYENEYTPIKVNMSGLLKYATSDEKMIYLAMQKINLEGQGVELISDKDDISSNHTREKIINYDPSTSKDLLGNNLTDFEKHISKVITTSLTTNGVDYDSVNIDDNGIVQYHGYVYGRAVYKPESRQEILGTIGQIFEPDSRGVIITKFNTEKADQNYAIVPGYKAHIINGKGSSESRTRLEGYIQLLDKSIKYSIHDDIMRAQKPPYNRPEDPSGKSISNNCFIVNGLSNTKLNYIYRNLSDLKLSKDYMKELYDRGLNNEFSEALIDFQLNSVRYSSKYGEESKSDAVRNANKNGVIINDNNADSFSKVRRNIAIISDSEKGYFDPIATGTSTQGLSRVLASGATVSYEGTINPSSEIQPYCKLIKLLGDDFRKIPRDRQTMVLSNLKSALIVDPSVTTAHMTLQGWTMDDGNVISKAFAENHRVYDSTYIRYVKGPDGNMIEDHYRPLRIGDKLCDFYGNKGVISMVVDPDMPEAIAQKEKLDYLVSLFKNNPDLEVVSAPFTAPSRYNAGTAAQMLKNSSDLLLPDGKIISGGMGKLSYIVTDKTVDEKTHLYENTENGKGRKASSQGLWQLEAYQADAIIRELYKDNINNVREVREKLIVLGYDIDDTYTLRDHYTPHTTDNGEKEERNIIKIDTPDFGYPPIKYNIRSTMDITEDVSCQIGRKGGFLEIPFPITLLNGKETEKIKTEDGKDAYLLPLLPPNYRLDNYFDDNTLIVNNYSRYYKSIISKAAEYKQREAIDTFIKQMGDNIPPEHRKSEQYIANNLDEKNKTQSSAQAHYDNIAKEINSQMSGKYNLFKTKIMSHRMPNSATAVLTADPRLNIEEISMSNKMANILNVKEGEYVLAWRDPLLRKEGMAGLKVVIDNNLVGVAINPIMDKRFDGDFDGDTIGLIGLQTKEAKKQLEELMSVKNTLIDYGETPDNPTSIKDISPSLNTSLDVASVLGEYKNTETGSKLTKLYESGLEALLENNNEKALDYFNKFSHETLDLAKASDIIQYDTLEHHFESQNRLVVDHKAKGSVDKLVDYGKYLGADLKIIEDENGKKRIDTKDITVNNTPMCDDIENPERMALAYNMSRGTEQATAIKDENTAKAGKVAQQGAMYGIDSGHIQDVLECCKGATHGLLQAKHDPEEARKKNECVNEIIPALFSGKSIKLDKNKDKFKVEVGENGNYIRNNKVNFIKQYYELCTNENGLNMAISEDRIKKTADVLWTIDEKGRDKIKSVTRPEPGDTAFLYAKTYANVKLNDWIGSNIYGNQNSILQNIKPEGSLVQPKYNEKMDKYLNKQSQVVIAESVSTHPMQNIDKEDVINISSDKETNINLIKQTVNHQNLKKENDLSYSKDN